MELQELFFVRIKCVILYTPIRIHEYIDRRNDREGTGHYHAI